MLFNTSQENPTALKLVISDQDLSDTSVKIKPMSLIKQHFNLLFVLW